MSNRNLFPGLANIVAHMAEMPQGQLAHLSILVISSSQSGGQSRGDNYMWLVNVDKVKSEMSDIRRKGEMTE